VQGFKYDTSTKIYYADNIFVETGATGGTAATGPGKYYAKTEIGAPIASALGCTAGEIQGLLLDIPLSTIKKLV
jgi:hypothetical protein